jgi:peptidoglycan/xylan/chitin deacetylase (PgdA/CDA1 family)
MEIGSHSVSHVRLTTVDDIRLRRELVDSKAMLEDAVGHEVVSFAYPYGDWDERCEAAAREASYRFACTTVTGWAMRDANFYRLRRLTVFNDDGLGRFTRKLAFGTHDVGWGQLLGYWGRRLQARMGWQP